MITLSTGEVIALMIGFAFFPLLFCMIGYFGAYNKFEARLSKPSLYAKNNQKAAINAVLNDINIETINYNFLDVVMLSGIMPGLTFIAVKKDGKRYMLEFNNQNEYMGMKG